MPFSKSGENTTEQKWNVLRIFLESEACIKFCVNSKWALRPVFEHFGLDSLTPRNIWDPVIATWVLNPDLDAYTWLDIIFENFHETASRDVKKNVEFLLEDVVLSFSIWTDLHAKLENADLLSPFRREMKIVPILSKIEVTGIGFNPGCLKNYQDFLQNRIANIKTKAETLLGHAINLTSPAQVAKALYDELKLTPKITTKTKTTTPKGKRSTSIAVLKLMAETGHPFPNLVLQYRKISKYLSSWIVKSSLPKYSIAHPEENVEDEDVEMADIEKKDSILLASSEDSDSLDLQTIFKTAKQKTSAAKMTNANSVAKTDVQRIHAHWMHTGTATGRLSCKDPNLQNLPRSALVLSVTEEDSQFLGDEGSETISVTIRDAFESRPGK
eukprot:TRINITY_DN4324_c0_g1_i4.p1 TRINITY_DN4324_c0_g1~~TRINITY_DN4324_c0_g1_i4.p1  ORF type:complete len:385 (+),score=71.48 TRINITY_DN4324_c0_g1_i4:1546-2700(+)